MPDGIATPGPIVGTTGAGAPPPKTSPEPRARIKPTDPPPEFTTRTSTEGPPKGNPGRRGKWTEVYAAIDAASANGEWFVAEGLSERNASNLRSSVRQHYRDTGVSVISRKEPSGTYAVWARKAEA